MNLSSISGTIIFSKSGVSATAFIVVGCKSGRVSGALSVLKTLGSNSRISSR